MSWDAIDEKLDRHDYWDLHAFKVYPGRPYCVTLNLTLAG